MQFGVVSSVRPQQKRQGSALRYRDFVMFLIKRSAATQRRPAQKAAAAICVVAPKVCTPDFSGSNPLVPVIPVTALVDPAGAGTDSPW